jgi:hypothetical protein
MIRAQAIVAAGLLVPTTMALAGGDGLCDTPPGDSCAEVGEFVQVFPFPFDVVGGAVGHCPEGSALEHEPFNCSGDQNPPGPAQILCEESVEDPMVARCQIAPLGDGLTYTWSTTGVLMDAGDGFAVNPPGVAEALGAVYHVTCKRRGEGWVNGTVTAANGLSSATKLRFWCR